MPHTWIRSMLVFRAFCFPSPDAVKRNRLGGLAQCGEVPPMRGEARDTVTVKQLRVRAQTDARFGLRHPCQP